MLYEVFQSSDGGPDHTGLEAYQTDYRGTGAQTAFTEAVTG